MSTFEERPELPARMIEPKLGWCFASNAALVADDDPFAALLCGDSNSLCTRLICTREPRCLEYYHLFLHGHPAYHKVCVEVRSAAVVTY
jgi:hypothetical protein